MFGGGILTCTSNASMKSYINSQLVVIPLGLSDPTGTLPFHKISGFYKVSVLHILLSGCH